MHGGNDHRVRWPLVAFAGLSLCGVLGLLLPLPDSTPGLRLALNLSHVPLFALWAVLLLRLWLQLRGARHALMACALLGLAVALGSEALQGLQPSRQVDARDAFSNVAGVGLGLAFARWRWRQRFARA